MLLLYRIVLVYLFYTLCRVAFGVYNYDLLQMNSWEAWARAFWGGVRFDTVSILYTNLLVIVLHLAPLRARTKRTYQRWLRTLYFVCNIPALILNVGDMVYYRFTMRRTTMSVFEEFANDGGWQFLSFVYEYWYATLLVVALAALWVYLYNRIQAREAVRQLSPKRFYALSVLGIVVVGVLVVAGIRGHGFGHMRPINTYFAASYIERPHQRALVLNTPFSLIRSIGRVGLRPLSYMSEGEARALFGARYEISSESPMFGAFSGRNVVVIIWESLAREWVGALNRDIAGYRGFTPFVDTLLGRSYYFDLAYAGASQSIDAMPAIFASVPRPVTSFVNSPYSGNQLCALPEVLRTHGYTTAFFHNAFNGSMYFDTFAQQIGFERYYGMNEYGNDANYDGRWGIWDEEFLQFFAHTLTELPQPFLASEFTTTSHQPFNVPDAFAAKHPVGSHPLHRPIRYTDYALERFFQTAARQPWYNNTLFIILADHAVPGEREEYKTSEGVFRIPIIFFDPRGELVGHNTTSVVQQADIYPTLMSLLGISQPIMAFGRDMFSGDDENRFAVNMIDGAYQMITQQYVLHYDTQRVLSLYDRVADPKLKRDLKDQRPEVVEQLLPRLQAYLQEFYDRMINNKLCP